jgi:hypothetical protein
MLGSFGPVPDVIVCPWLSLFVHVTVSPTLTVTASGENALSARFAAPATIDTFVVLPELDAVELDVVELDVV